MRYFGHLMRCNGDSTEWIQAKAERKRDLYEGRRFVAKVYPTNKKASLSTESCIDVTATCLASENRFECEEHACVCVCTVLDNLYKSGTDRMLRTDDF